MRKTVSARRGPSLLGILLLGGGVLLLGGVLVLGALLLLGVVTLGFLRQAAPAEPYVIPDSMVLAPVAARDIPAYTKITRDHFWDTKKGDFAGVPIRRSAVKPGLVLDMTKAFGRVLKAEKHSQYAFTEDDFLPEGTRPGVVAGVPEGKRAFVLDVEKVNGMHILRAGDHFDLVGSLPLDDKATGRPHGNGLGLIQGSPLITGPSPSQAPKHTAVKVLVQDGVIITPVAVRQHAVDPAKPAPKIPPKEKPVEDVTVAIDPTEVSGLSEAIALKAEVTCVARSGRPDESKDDRLPTPEEPKVWRVEAIHGNKREWHEFPIPPKPADKSAASK